MKGSLRVNWLTHYFSALFFLCTDSICPIIFDFRAKFLSQMLHLNGLFPSWTEYDILNNFFEKSCSHKFHIRMVSFFHERMQHVVSFDFLKNSCNHKRHIWIPYFLHELIEHVVSNDIFRTAIVTNVSFEWLISVINW